MRRYRVKAPSKTWTDRGPDLLRTRGNAVTTTGDLLDRGGPYSIRKEKRPAGFTRPIETGSKQDTLAALGDYLPTLNKGQELQVLDATDVVAVVRAEDVKVSDLANATGRAEQTWALIRHQYGRAVGFGGCYVCKQVSGSSDWSDHAWGDAIDATPRQLARVTNDELFEWERRMAIERLLPVELLIGSKNGKVVSARKATSWRVDAGGDDSHLWHVHTSCREHSGTPPCA